MLNISINSIQLKNLIVEEPKMEYPIYPPFSVLLRSTIGSGKTTSLRALSKGLNVPIIEEVTFAGLIGSLRGHEFFEGAITANPNSIVLMDEWQPSGRSGQSVHIYRAMLGLIDGGSFTRKTGAGRLSEGIKKKWYTIAKDGTLNVRSHSAFIIATMKKPESFRGDNFKALVSRCCPIDCKWERKDLERLLSGEPLYTNLGFNPKTDIKINIEDYKEIKNYCDTIRYDELYIRTFNELCKIFAITGKHSPEIYKEYIKRKENFFSRIGLYFKKS